MTTERIVYIKALQEINALIVEKKRIADEYGRRGDRDYGDGRRVSWSLAAAYEKEASDLTETLRAVSSLLPWPLVREPSVPATPDDEYYSSYDCPRCLHDGTDRTFPPPPTCQRCGARVKHVPY